jgi:hypothetical protein
MRPAIRSRRSLLGKGSMRWKTIPGQRWTRRTASRRIMIYTFGSTARTRMARSSHSTLPSAVSTLPRPAIDTDPTGCQTRERSRENCFAPLPPFTLGSLIANRPTSEADISIMFPLRCVALMRSEARQRHGASLWAAAVLPARPGACRRGRCPCWWARGTSCRCRPAAG